jgi:hypothetical protein
VATRFYFPSSATPAPAVSPTFSAEWEHQAGVRRIMRATKGTQALATQGYSPDGADHLVDQDALGIQFITDEILAAQTIAAQTVTLTVQALEGNAGNNLFLTWKLFVVDGTTGAIKETLLAIRRDATELATSLTSRTDAATTTSATVEEGDRIVLEVGFGGLPTAAGGVQGHNGSMRWGEDGASDLLANDSQTGTTLNPWLEFANTLTFATPPQSKNGTDSGTGSDANAGVAVTDPADAGSGSDTSVDIGQTASDSSSAAETAEISITSSDAGTGADSSPAHEQATTDSGAGTDPTPALGLSATDSGTGADTSASLVEETPKDASDSGTSTETAYISITVVDSDSGTETSSGTAEIAATDQGTGADAPREIALGATDSGSSTETPAGTAEATGADSGTGADTGAVSVPVASSDSGVGADSADSLERATSDAGTGAEATSSEAAAAAADEGLGAELGTLEAILSGTDQAAGSEASGLDSGDEVNKTASDAGTGLDTAVLTFPGPNVLVVGDRANLLQIAVRLVATLEERQELVGASASTTEDLATATLEVQP